MYICWGVGGVGFLGAEVSVCEGGGGERTERMADTDRQTVRQTNRFAHKYDRRRIMCTILTVRVHGNLIKRRTQPC